MSRRHSNDRRGNALVLVAGVLVLLVLVATAYITRTHGGRITARAQMESASRSDNARMIAEAVADEIAGSLFAKPIDTTVVSAVFPTSANARRGASWPDAQRYDHDPLYAYNFAPYPVVAWTNPPDDTINFPALPAIGPSNPLGGPSFGDTRWLRDLEPLRADLIAEAPQPDTAIWGSMAGQMDGTPETFSHWRHLTNLARSNNAWRICRRISDVGNIIDIDGDGINDGGLLTNLDVPLEQWPNQRPLRGTGELIVHPGTGYPNIDFDGDGAVADAGGDVDPEDFVEFQARWEIWRSVPGWAFAHNNNPQALPQNFIDLNDLDGDGIPNELGEHPRDALEPGTPRHMVESILTDTDGDGFTDAFWHLSPFLSGPDTRQVVAVSVTDNSGRMPLNVATRFQRKDYYGNTDARNLFGEATRGHTPADLAAVGQNELAFGNIFPWRVGFMDAPSNNPGWDWFDGAEWVTYDQVGYADGNGYRVRVEWDTDQWDSQGNASLLDELGVDGNAVFEDGGTGGINPTDDTSSRYGRLWYWQLAGRRPFEATSGLRPFTLADELELRICEGNNYQSVGSRFERSTNGIFGQTSGGEVVDQFLRSDYEHRHEASELRDQIRNEQLLNDNRRKITLFSGTRNDLLPPWLRWDERFYRRYDPTAAGLPVGRDAFDFNNYGGGISEWAEMYPLRVRQEGAYIFSAQIDVNNDGTVDEGDVQWVADKWREQSRTRADLREYYADFSFDDPWWESEIDGRISLAERAPISILLALTDGQEEGFKTLDERGLSPDVDAHAPGGTYNDGSIDLVGDIVGDTSDPYQQARLVAAGLASNLLAYRDDDDTWRMHSRLPAVPGTNLSRSNLPLSAAVAPPVLGRQMDDAGDLFFGGPNDPDVHMLGLEAQPFIMEVFFAHVHEAEQHGLGTALDPIYHRVVADAAESPQETVIAVQLANPFLREIDLDDYELDFLGQTYAFNTVPGQMMPPATAENPATAIVYAISDSPTIIASGNDFKLEWLDFLDLEISDHPSFAASDPYETLLIEVPDGTWETSSRATYDDMARGDTDGVALFKWDFDTSGGSAADQRVLVDRLDRPDEDESFDEMVLDTFEEQWNELVTAADSTLGDAYIEAKNFEGTDGETVLMVQWARATRSWGMDVPNVDGLHSGTYDAWERNPRFVFAARDLREAAGSGSIWGDNNLPDERSNHINLGAELANIIFFDWTAFGDPDDRDTAAANPDSDGDGDPDAYDPWFTVDCWAPFAGPHLIDTDGDGSLDMGMGDTLARKPTAFDMHHADDPLFASGEWSFPDKGWYMQREDDAGNGTTADDPAFEDTDGDGFFAAAERDMLAPFPMQMLQKDSDFEQVGELLNCWLLGHMLEGDYSPVVPNDYFKVGATNGGTVVTFSEFMAPVDTDDWWSSIVGDTSSGEVELDEYVNRLRFSLDDDGFPMLVGGGDPAAGFDYPWPRLSIAARVLDAFCCDGPGRPDYTDGFTVGVLDGIGDDLFPGAVFPADPPVHSFYNANGYSGDATPGMININTASVEVIRALPHMYKLVHATSEAESGSLDTADRNPRSALPEAMVQWRDGGSGRLNYELGTGYTGGPNYSDRNTALGLANAEEVIENTRGFHSAAQVGQLTRAGSVDDVFEPWHISGGRHQAIRDANAWSREFAAFEPFDSHDSTGTADFIGTGYGAELSTDVVGPRTNALMPTTIQPDGVSGDSEEMNLLLSGMSNLITTTSDMFTVHMRIRTFKRNPVTGRWDATDPDYIVDDSRYVMLVDRSHVNSPSDKASILYLEKLPN